MKTIRCGVIGVGYLGRFHAQKHSQLPHATLVGVSDLNPQTTDAVAQELGVTGYRDFRAMLPHIDAVSIAATTTAHYEIAKACLQAGVHVLVEKPITETVVQANTLIALAHQQGLKLQVGHLERFNAARLALEPFLHAPLFIESTRLAPFNPRGTDVNVILDLMIHDIDLIQTMVNSPIVHMDAQGTPILSPSIDIANTRIHFQNHCIANVTASRISFKTERKTRIFQRHSYLSIDYHQKQFAVFSKGEGEMFPGIPNIIRHESALEQKDALLEEIKAFLVCIEQNTKPLVTGEEGRDALGTAQMISDLIHHHQQTVQQSYDEC